MPDCDKKGEILTMAVGKKCEKIEGRAIAQGRPLYTDDLCPEEHLIAKALRSPYAYARIKKIDKTEALKIEGVELIFDYRDVPRVLHSIAAEAYPEGSPYDRFMLDEYVRYVGDVVLIVAAWTEQACEKALKAVRVEYEILEPILDYRKSIDNEIRLHQEVFTNFNVGAQPERNIPTSLCREWGDVDQVMSECAYVVEGVYETSSQEHAMLETHRAFSYQDDRGRIVIVGCIHSPFHVQRIVSKLLQVKMSDIRVISVKSGGSFGGKNSIFVEHFCAYVTHKTGYACEMVLTREECFEASTTRHGACTKIRVGGDEEGYIRAIDIDFTTNTGAYAEHAYDVLCVGCSNTLPIYSKCRALRYRGQAAYSNKLAAGAFRGFGGPQTTFALAAAVGNLAAKMGRPIDEVELKNIIREGETHPFLSGGTVDAPVTLGSSTLEKCIRRGKELIHWDEIYPCRRISSHKVKAVGMAVTMHGSGIAKLDLVGVDIRFNQDGSYTLYSGVADLGTGGQTALLQIAAEVLMTTVDNIRFVGADTDITPYDKGPYASSTVYITGEATRKAAEKLKHTLIQKVSGIFSCEPKDISFDGTEFSCSEKAMTLEELGVQMVQFGGMHPVMETASHGSNVAPPPFVAGFAEIELDELTGEVAVTDYAICVDCGTVINPNFARAQVEGGTVQGIGFALYEDMVYSTKGKLLSNNYKKYHIPTVLDIPDIKVEFIESYEPTGPFGAKSLGEVVIHSPIGSIHNAIYNACGADITSLPMTPEKIWKAMNQNKVNGD